MTKQPNLPESVGPATWVGPGDDAYAESGLIHFAQIPDEASKDNRVPAVVMVHGWGGNEKVMWIFKQAMPSNVAIITPRATSEIEEDSFIWFDRDMSDIYHPEPETFMLALNSLERLIDALPKLYPIKRERVLLIGFSQGGAIANSLVLTRPEMAIGMASLASFVPDLPDYLPRVDSLLDFPVFIAHGTADDTVPIEAAQDTRDIYQKLGADIAYGEYDVGHKMSSQAIKDLKQWVGEVFAFD